ncbi:hypothetical protein ACFE04_007248 [Oxalis oulophora]
MEEGFSEDVNSTIDGPQQQHGKDVACSMKPENGRILESKPIVVIPRDDTNSPEGSYHVLANMLEGKDVDTSLHFTNASNTSRLSPLDDGGMVEELTVRNYNSANLAIVGPSNNKDRIPQNHWQDLYQLAGGSGSGSLDKNIISDDVQMQGGHDLAAEDFANVENNRISGQPSPHSNIRTKILSRSGFSEFFVKTTLKGKGIVCRGPRNNRDPRLTISTGGTPEAPIALPKTDKNTFPTPNVSSSFDPKSSVSCQNDDAERRPGVFDQDGVTLREWLKTEHHKVSKVVRLFKFRQIVELVETYHSRGVGLQNLQPTYFKLLQPNLIKYVGSTVQSGILDKDIPHPDEDNPIPVNNWLGKRRLLDHGITPYSAPSTKKQKFSENMNVNSQWPSFTSNYGFRNEVKQHFRSLLGRYESEKAHVAAMADLRHRILPPNFLSENPKEAGFCLWLLHPQPSSRPATREILQSDLITGLSEIRAEELAASIEQDDSESELLSHSLFLMQDYKQKQASKLEEDIKCLESDIAEVISRHHLPNKTLCDAWDNKLLKNIVQLENAYFSTRSMIQPTEVDSTTRADKDLFRDSDSWRHSTKPDDPLGAFFGGLCKYARYNKFEVRGLLRTSDLNNSANVICSLSFDRDEDFFASAGVSKKIKIFEFNALLNDSVDIHYPVTEMSNKSMLSCVSWNNYIKNYLASTDYDGVVKLWDATTGQVVSHYMEHEKRAWSVDFSPVCPTKLASGSDDCSVKLWGINEFSTHSTHLLAFGSADYRTYCYDVRNMRSPWCVLSGHEKAVSFVKFVDSETIVTASTDNSLKLWDLNKTNPNGLSTNACSLSFSGHTNEKNFVGLATGDGYIACGSETNEVYAYHRSLPMPITSHKFGSIDPISGRATNDDNGLFISSVCWRGKSDMVVAANSSGWKIHWVSIICLYTITANNRDLNQSARPSEPSGLLCLAVVLMVLSSIRCTCLAFNEISSSIHWSYFPTEQKDDSKFNFEKFAILQHKKLAKQGLTGLRRPGLLGLRAMRPLALGLRPKAFSCVFLGDSALGDCTFGDFSLSDVALGNCIFCGCALGDFRFSDCGLCRTALCDTEKSNQHVNLSNQTKMHAYLFRSDS